jgi:ribosomal RNA methyltransferase Nop2
MGDADSDSGSGDLDAEEGDDLLVGQGDGFGMSDDDDEEDLGGELEHDSAFDTSDDDAEGLDGDKDDEDVEMDESDELPPHLRPNAGIALDSDDEGVDGQITTNLMQDITASDFTLPAVTKIRAKTAADPNLGESDDEDEVDEIEGRTSLRDVESRMRWLVGVLGGKEKDEDGGVIAGGKFRGLKGL